MASQKICREFSQKGTCRFKNCKFLHIGNNYKTPNDEHKPASSSSTKPSNRLSNSEKQFRAWRHTIPFSSKAIVPNSKLTAIFQEARRLIEIEVGVRQSVIQTLSGEGGLNCIRAMIEQDFEQLIGRMKEQIFKTQVLPFLEVISHPEVLQSLVLEQAVGTVYNLVFGVGGVRASKLLGLCSGILMDCIKDESTAVWLETSLLVFSRIVDLNSTALVQDSLKRCTRQFQDIFIAWVKDHPENPLQQSRMHMERLLRRFEIGSSLPTILPSGHSQPPKTPGGFVSKREPPGGRHDNDHADICHIRIMPSYQEIFSRRIEYLPLYDPAQWHIGGLPGLLDRNFRLLREDTIGLLRDAIHFQIQKSQNSLNSKNQRRINVYQDARIVELRFDKMDGFQFMVGFPQPPHVSAKTTTKREEWWNMSKRLQSGALVCLVMQRMAVVFCTVANSQAPTTKRQGQNDNEQEVKDPGSLWKDSQEASIILGLTSVGSRAIEVVLKQHMHKGSRFTIVEFPGVLLPAFEPTLKALQLMKISQNLPFSELLIPSSSTTGSLIDVSPPPYATTPGFQFNLRCLMRDDSNIYIRPGQAIDIHRLRQCSSLDDAQASALVNTLQRKLGLIQGPPGTGKSFTGIALIKVILANRIKKLGPIICVTYTNHALDQLLESLLEKDVTKQVIRIGSRSMSESLQAYNLKTLGRNFDKTKLEKSSQWESHRSLESYEKEFGGIGLRQGISPTRIMLHLRDNYPSHYNKLFRIDDDGFQRVHSEDCGKVFNQWRRSGGKATTGTHRDVIQLESISPFQMSRPEREKLYAHWQIQLETEMQESLTNICISHRDTKREFDNIRSEVDLRCLGQADVIGVTTSGLARNLNMLRRLQSKVVVCEEAGEVLESHLLTALLPSVEHAIFIGDHYQLRPQVQNYELSRENKNGGERYSLDVSLFERLVELDGPMGCGLPYSALQTQRRMHPSIAQLVRDTLYPQLQDSPSVFEYPDVKGVRKRLFWLDHRMPEGNLSNDEASATSRWNEFEVEMTTALVNHLVRQGSYGHGEIAVLTPYLGQLQRLRRRLSHSFAITVGDRDQDDLDKAGLQEDEQTSNATGVRTTLLQTLRVATVDNFQGEEASVVVISLVRSNPQNNCGFLRTSNRINVLLSRAKHGMYIIGNSMTAMKVPMWADVIDIFHRNDNIGTSLQLQCPRHPDTNITVSEPDDFPRVSPEGGCSLRCVNRLSCGHACVQKCHSEVLHNAVYCLEPCQRPRQTCSHACSKKCGDKCPSRCMVSVFQADRRLKCGHLMQNLPCWQSQNLSTVLCTVPVDKTVANCGHKVSVACHTDVDSPRYRCTVQCQSLLACGHSCKKQCFGCVTITESGDINTDHGSCRQECHRDQSTCAHRCKTPCHGDLPCPPCQDPCEVDCVHSICAKKCSEPCTPCAEEKCLSSCPHSTCTMPCAAPCDHIPCSLRCDKLLACGHQCPSVCGEICPPQKYCQICGNEEIKDHMVDFILGETYKEINLDENPCIFPKCGHFLTIENMDAQMDLGRYYILDERGRPCDIATLSEPFSINDIKTCASCRGPLRDITRYGRLVRRAILDESTKKLILYLNREYVPLAQELTKCVRELQETKHTLPVTWPSTIKINDKRKSQVASMKKVVSPTNKGRWKNILNLRQRIENYQNQVAPEEQPYSRVYNLVANARRQQKTAMTFDIGNEILQTKGSIQAAALSLRLDIALLADFLELRRGAPKAAEIEVVMDLSSMKTKCEALIKTASESKRVLHQAEGYIFMAQLHAFERSHTASPDLADQHLTQGKEAINHAKIFCTDYPGQTRGLLDEIKGAEKMFLGTTFYTTVTNEERMAVIAAMAREFRGTGHWYYCQNGHPFTIGECGMAMQRSVCPECGAPVGGQNHTAAEGVTHATDMEVAFGQMALN